MTDDFMHQCEDELYGVLLRLRTKEDCKALLEDLCTYKEVEQMALRAHAAKLFMEGKTYAEITRETELSSATISRVSRSVTHGSGGYRAFISLDSEKNPYPAETAEAAAAPDTPDTPDTPVAAPDTPDTPDTKVAPDAQVLDAVE